MTYSPRHLLLAPFEILDSLRQRHLSVLLVLVISGKGLFHWLMPMFTIIAGVLVAKRRTLVNDSMALR